MRTRRAGTSVPVGAGHQNSYAAAVSTVRRPRVLLATFAAMPDGEPAGDLLTTALVERGVDAAWAVWDDAGVDWAAADLVAVRATWDYHRRADEFLGWARRTASATRLLNGPDAFAWNGDKAYLVPLAEHVPAVPTATLDGGGPGDPAFDDGLRAALATHGTVVVKSRWGAGGVGVVVVDRVDEPRLADLASGPWLVQPLVESVRTEGETSVFVLRSGPGGAAQVVGQVRKVPAPGEVRVHEEYGGRSTAVPPTDEAATTALAAVAAAEALLGARLDYARADLVRVDGGLVVGELEVIEPGLYLDVAPAHAQAFADLVRLALDQVEC